MERFRIIIFCNNFFNNCNKIDGPQRDIRAMLDALEMKLERAKLRWFEDVQRKDGECVGRRMKLVQEGRTGGRV